VLTEAIIRVEFAIERLGVVNGARIEFALVVFAQEGATSGSEKATQIVGVARVNR
jgi:predicted ThiF/HesA family dinucleotide-utilizing enzyme